MFFDLFPCGLQKLSSLKICNIEGLNFCKMNTIAELKSALHQQVAVTEDKKILMKMRAYFSSLAKRDKKIVAYGAKWKPLTAKEYKETIENSILQYKQGKVISQKEMEKRI
jgi:chromosome segregation and condensation protein ScpB